MNPIFSASDWKRTKENSDKWWKGTLGRPLIQVRLLDSDVTPSDSALPFHEFTSFYDFEVSPEQVVEAWEVRLRSTLHLGDAFPVICPNFGPGSIAAYMGAELENGKDTVWFHPKEGIEIDELEFKYDPNNKWFLRTKDVIRAAEARWKGSVQIAMTDLGGNMDILSTFRPSEEVIYDLYDDPETVEQLNWKSSELWWQYFQELSALAPSNPGYSNWANIFSTEPHYILQSDFSFMIGPDMFDQFVQPELEATSRKLNRVFYHMDGIGQLKHFEKLLAMDSIHGIQWVAGAGQPDVTHWPDIMKMIADAGKRLHICSNMADDPFTVLDKINDQCGKVDHIVYTFNGDRKADEEGVLKMLEKYQLSSSI